MHRGWTYLKIMIVRQCVLDHVDDPIALGFRHLIDLVQMLAKCEDGLAPSDWIGPYQRMNGFIFLVCVVRRSTRTLVKIEIVPHRGFSIQWLPERYCQRLQEVLDRL